MNAFYAQQILKPEIVYLKVFKMQVKYHSFFLYKSNFNFLYMTSVMRTNDNHGDFSV